MRQAGRTLPEYMALREQHSFLELMGTPELAAEVTLQPLRRFPLDAAVIFSDILVIPAALGQAVGFEGGLSLSPAISGPADFASLSGSPVAEKLAHVLAALKLVRAELGSEKALLGFAGAPFTVASYMVEGGSSKSYARLKSLMYREPEFFRELLFAVADATVEYLKLQFDAGADAVQLFDSWAGELSPEDYREFALPAARRVAEGIRGSGVPLIYFINGIGNVLESASEIGADIIGVDWRISLPEVRRRLGADTVVQGNLDPGVLFAPPEEITRRTHAMLDSTGGRGHIANLGHGLMPGIPLTGIGAFIDAVISWRREDA
jgi:uroporphyrinogen decarboxylase